MKFTDINPNKLIDEFSQANIKTINGISSDLVLPKLIAENAECEFIEGTDMDKVAEILANHNPNVEVIKELTTEEKLSKEVASLKIDSMEKDTIITSTLQTIASLKVEIMGLKGGSL